MQLHNVFGSYRRYLVRLSGLGLHSGSCTSTYLIKFYTQCCAYLY